MASVGWFEAGTVTDRVLGDSSNGVLAGCGTSALDSCLAFDPTSISIACEDVAAGAR